MMIKLTVVFSVICTIQKHFYGLQWPCIVARSGVKNLQWTFSSSSAKKVWKIKKKGRKEYKYSSRENNKYMIEMSLF